MIIDLRSDTVTKPSTGMKEAMFNAPLGDDVFNDDPSVNELEEVVADLFGMEASIFCPSGTMTNQIAIKINSNAPGEIICDALSHVYKYEGGGIGFNSGLATNLLNGNKGRLNANQIEAAIKIDDPHFPETQLVSLENTCNKGGGSIYDISEIKKINVLCKNTNLKLHLDGARLFNAIIESNYSTKDIGKEFDTISICLSKGLGAPVGSMLISNFKNIKKARKIRKLFGGGMRQAGLIAAAGTYAIRNNISRLKEDHKRAKILGNELRGLNYVKNVLPVYTNIVVAEIPSEIDYLDVIDQFAKLGLKSVPFGPNQIRFVTHLDFTDLMLEKSINIFNSISVEGTNKLY
ncbi:MAG: beta-eliminating lyase-related protein [Saprospiraceae bacterium]|nr:beta-eliminating lyase-related protein [Saprospiraceae bacterium]